MTSLERTGGIARDDVLVALSTPSRADIADPLLTPAERARCLAFRHLPAAAQHATGRRLVREAGARWLGVAPTRVGVLPDPDPLTNRRPFLTLDSRPLGSPGLSITHAGDVVAVALHAGACGIDVEVIEPVRCLIGSDVVYTEAERAILADTPEPDRAVLAARWWTAKEAVLKAVGVGMGADPNEIDVTGELVTFTSRFGGTSTWRLRPVSVAAGHVATLALPVTAT